MRRLTVPSSGAAALRKAQAAGTPAGDAPVFGLTDFAHLTPAEFRKLYLSQPFAQLKRQVDETEASASVSAADEQPGSSDEATGQRDDEPPGGGFGRTQHAQDGTVQMAG